jgi:PleD family two-component response regulator
MLKQQNERCAICDELLDKAEKTHIDHNHTTNKVRGILCHGCNTSLGGFKDSISILKSALEYLSKHENRDG